VHREQDRTAAPLKELAEEAAKGLTQVSPSAGLGRDAKAFLERMRIFPGDAGSRDRRKIRGSCRAETTTEYGFGDDTGRLGEYGWFGGNRNGQTQPGDAGSRTTWGLHDMHGKMRWNKLACSINALSVRFPESCMMMR